MQNAAKNHCTQEMKSSYLIRKNIFQTLIVIYMRITLIFIFTIYYYLY